jgi:glucosamine--fructose-6-phosphate aminotransferase (isomerizing)
MCGIVGAVSERDVVPILLEGLKRLEYRGYDSAGIAVLQGANHLQRSRAQGKVAVLNEQLQQNPIQGTTGIAHTRWATHGKPSERNAHPHMAGNRVVLVHNGIIENYESLKEKLGKTKEAILSDTDSEIVAYHIYEKLKTGKDLLQAVSETAQELQGAYAICVMDTEEPGRVIGLRNGPPLVVGLGQSASENFLASDVLALQKVSEQFIYLEDGDLVDITKQGARFIDKSGKVVQRKIYNRNFKQDAADKAGYDHFMLKEIFEQPNAILDTLNGRYSEGQVLEQIFGVDAPQIFKKVERIQIVACGTSFHAGLIGKLWLESLANLPCNIEIASEFRYRKRVQQPGSLLICISQSGETADTLAALRGIKPSEYCGTLSICNVPDSSLVRESELVLMTNAGPEIGVCSTKAFTTQLVALLLLTLTLGKRHGLDRATEQTLLKHLKELPQKIQMVLDHAKAIESLAKIFAHKSHTLFLGRGLQFPIALEGALKLKEISYIHAEAYPAGELKHGPLALVDKDMPVVVVAPNDSLLEKLKSNIEEVRTRGGELIVFAPKSSNIKAMSGLHIFEMPESDEWLAPIIYTIPLQLLAYYVAILKGTDVDQPRNLAKSVTVE